MDVVGVNYFDLIGDSELLPIFNRIGDLKTLCRCCAVSRRFNDLATQVDNVVIKVPWTIFYSGKYESSLISLLQALYYGIYELGLSLSLKRSYPLPKLPPFLKRFSEIRVLKIELPIDGVVFLKWKTEYELSFGKGVVFPDESVCTWSILRKICAADYYCRCSLRRIMAEHSKLDRLVLTDANGEGALWITSLRERSSERCSGNKHKQKVIVRLYRLDV